MLGLLQSLLALIIFISRYELLLVEVLLTLEICLRLFQVDFRQTHTHLGRAQLSHLRHHLHLGNHITRIHEITCLLVKFSDDTRNLRLDVDLITRLNLTCDNGRLLDVLRLWGELIVDDLLGLALLPQEHECSDENQRDNSSDNQFSVLFHIVVFLIFNSILFLFVSHCVNRLDAHGPCCWG